MRRPAFSLEQIRSFVAVAEHEHISKAAASLYLTQGAVTQQIRHFERAVGLQLLERDGRSVRLTDAGRTLAVACRAALRAIEVLDDTADSMKSLRAGSLHIGASPTCASYYLPVRLAEFAGLHPGVKLEVEVDASSVLNRDVEAGTLDCALIEGDPAEGLLTDVIARDELLMVVHRDHPLSGLYELTPSDMAGHRYLRRGPSFSAESTVRELLGPAYDGLEVLTLGYPEYVHAAAVAGLGFAALPRLAVEADLRSGVLTVLPLPAVVRPITAIRRPSRGGPIQEAFWDHLVRHVGPGTSARITVGAAGPT
ncbi:MAG TPA: LysR family transcriptional regulator [Candidatus Dormibacteraeota bacterium]